ncbi:hypothetical protein GKR41_00517 [Candidatus Vallotia lariciata]|nr:hypothetical protein GKR41_00517 [Candidatus Vallotia lariciata]
MHNQYQRIHRTHLMYVWHKYSLFDYLVKLYFQSVFLEKATELRALMPEYKCYPALC